MRDARAVGDLGGRDRASARRKLFERDGRLRYRVREWIGDADRDVARPAPTGTDVDGLRSDLHERRTGGEGREHEIGDAVHLDAVGVRDPEARVARGGAGGNRERGAPVAIGVRVELCVRAAGDLARAAEEQAHAGERSGPATNRDGVECDRSGLCGDGAIRKIDFHWTNRRGRRGLRARDPVVVLGAGPHRGDDGGRRAELAQILVVARRWSERETGAADDRGDLRLAVRGTGEKSNQVALVEWNGFLSLRRGGGEREAEGAGERSRRARHHRFRVLVSRGVASAGIPIVAFALVAFNNYSLT